MNLKNTLTAFIVLITSFLCGQDLIISEIHYNPADDELTLGDDLEFIELTNTGSESLNIEGYSFTEGIVYTFPLGSVIEAGESIVLTKNKTVFDTYFTLSAYGVYTGGLKNSGETITLTDISLATVVEITYDDTAPWPVLADGLGYSIELIDPLTPNEGASWVSSSELGGTPMAYDPELESVIFPILVNEVLANTLEDETEKIELYNFSDTVVNISLWFLTDDRKDPFKYQFRPGTTIEANSYLVVTSDDFGTDFSLSSKGEEVFIFSSYSSPSPSELWGSLSGFSNGMTYNVSDVSQSFGWHTTSDNNSKRFNLTTQSFGEANDVPVVGPLVFTDIMYSPDVLTDEFLIIKNISDSIVSSNSPYLVDSNAIRINGIGYKFDFTKPTSFHPGESFVLTSIDTALFKSKYGIDASVQVFQYTGALNNVEELIEIEIPIKRDTLDSGEYDNHYKTIDEVYYDSSIPWPTAAAGNGSYLKRITDSLYANDPINWVSTEDPLLGIYSTKLNSNISFEVFPNVTQSVLNINTDLVNGNFTINMLSGETVKQGTLKPIIEVNSLEHGMYIITIYSKEGSLSQRFIKQ